MTNKTLLAKEWKGDRRSPKFDFGKEGELEGNWDYPTLNLPSIFPINARSYYPFNQVTTLNDALGFQNLSSPGAFNSTTNGVKGATDYCIQFAAPSHFVSLPRLRNTGVTSFTLNMWFRKAGGLLNGYLASDQTIAGDAGGSFSLRFINDVPNLNIVRFSTSSTASLNLVAPLVSLTDNKWHPITIVHNAILNTVSLFIDKILTLSYTIPSGFVLNNSPQTFYFGKPVGATNIGGMFLDEVAIWDRALSFSEINRMVNTQYPELSAFLGGTMVGS
jgi:hypothetical protein